MDKVKHLTIIPLDKIQEARSKAPDAILNTPIVKLNHHIPGKEIFLKLENLQPVGSFKIRGAFNAAINLSKRYTGQHGLFTITGGNFGQALAWVAKRLDLPCNVWVPEHTSIIKSESMKKFGAQVTRRPYEECWECIVTGQCDSKLGVFVHPSCDDAVMAGNGVIGLEIFEQIPHVSSIVVPFGIGGNCAGIGSAVKQLKPGVNVYAAEIETACVCKSSLEAGYPIEFDEYVPTFVDCMDDKSMLPAMWNIVSHNVTRGISCTLREVCDAMKLVFDKNQLIIEPAAGVAVAAALNPDTPPGTIVCVVTGNNIDKNKLQIILDGEIPEKGC